MSSEGRELDLELHLLDRQVVDREGRLVCNVDDLELELDESGHPCVTAILVGPRALGPRIGGRLGHWFVAIAARLAGSEEPPRIDFRHVVEIGDVIKISPTVQELDVTSLENWVHDNVIARIPGSGHESE
jgi:sporulation protein YlmC with PRC-barrel domain